MALSQSPTSTLVREHEICARSGDPAATMQTPIGPLTVLAADDRVLRGRLHRATSARCSDRRGRRFDRQVEMVPTSARLPTRWRRTSRATSRALDGIAVYATGRRVSAAGLGGAPSDPARPADHLRRAGGPAWRRAIGPGGRDGLRHQPDCADRPVPPRDRHRRPPDRATTGAWTASAGCSTTSAATRESPSPPLRAATGEGSRPGARPTIAGTWGRPGGCHSRATRDADDRALGPRLRPSPSASGCWPIPRPASAARW